MLQVILLLLLSNVQASTREGTLTALREFKRQVVGGAGNELLGSWQMNDTSANGSYYCQWEGVRCDTHELGRVLGISLPHSGLQGTLSPALSNLTFLKYLDLSQNAISGGIPPFPHRMEILNLAENLLLGAIPSQLSNCTRLTALNLGQNRLSGSIPPSLSSLASLQVLKLFNNSLSGAIPSQLASCTQLQVLSLAKNRLSGSIPATFGNLAKIQLMALYSNNLTGSIPPELGNCSMLLSLDLSINTLTGAIPHQIGAIPFTGPSPTVDPPRELHGLLSLRDNLLSGFVPPALGNCSGLHFLDLMYNKLQGSIPQKLGDLTNLQELYLTHNNLTGHVPPSLGNLIHLQLLILNYNHLTGNIPASFSNLTALSQLDLGFNALSGSIPWDLGSLAQLEYLSLVSNSLSGTIPPSLANCTKLLSLELNVNQLNGALPAFFATLPHLYLLNLSVNHFSGRLLETFANASAIRTLYMANNSITGPIPSAFGKLVNLQRLNLQGNQLHGPIPAELGDCAALSELDLQGNKLQGPLPAQLGKLSFLQLFHVQHNALQGSIPDILGQCQRLQDFDLSHNNFSGPIPLSLFTLFSLQFRLVLSHNLLIGTIPSEVSNLQHIQVIDFSFNELSGTIPGTLWRCTELQTLDLSHNKLQGQIPNALGDLQNLASLDLSSNLLTGQIPANLLKLNFTASSFTSNTGLCGPPLAVPCPELGKSKQKKVSRSTIVFVSCGIAGILMIAFGLLLWYRRYRSPSKKKRSLQDSSKTTSSLHVTAEELDVATCQFDEINLIGTGGTSKVYKATIREGLVVAVKKFNLEGNQLDKAEHFFRKECETLGKMRHRNLVRILSTCCNLEMKALVLEYMSNGSLEKFLFESEGYQLSWRRLLDIALDVAQALVYLHHECDAPVIHCDLKPSNILLDEVYTAHVSDFGIARILSPGSTSYSASYFRGSIGYIAPECAELAHNSVKGDIYSYGVVLLCMLTGRQPTSEEFYEQGIEMPNWVKRFWPDKYLDALNPTLRLRVEASNKEREVLDLMEVALSCTARAPKQRPTSNEIVRTLLQIKSYSPHFAPHQLQQVSREPYYSY